MAVTIQFKRATAARWYEVNPILLLGEPGFEKDTHKLKIGDGETTWHNLPYVNWQPGGGEGTTEMVVVDIYQHLPLIGDENMIYRVKSEKTLYQWNATESEYEPLTSGGDFDPSNIKIINGGKSNG